MLGCRDSGWNVSTEVSGEGWRADVLATKGNSRIAFEVQWSKQTLIETEERQRNYAKNEVRGCWFFRLMPREHSVQEIARIDLPMFHLVEREEGKLGVAFESRSYSPDGRTYSLRDFVVKLLGGKIRFCEVATAKRMQKIRILFWEYECYRCKHIAHIYSASPIISDCEIPLDESTLWEVSRVEFLPEVQRAVRLFLSTERDKKIAIGKIKKRYSNVRKESYMSFGCAHCDAIVGDFYVDDYVLGNESAAAVFETEITFTKPPSITYPHWCLPVHGEFCCERKK